MLAKAPVKSLTPARQKAAIKLLVHVVFTFPSVCPQNATFSGCVQKDFLQTCTVFSTAQGNWRQAVCLGPFRYRSSHNVITWYMYFPGQQLEGCRSSIGDLGVVGRWSRQTVSPPNSCDGAEAWTSDTVTSVSPLKVLPDDCYRELPAHVFPRI